MAYVRDAEDAVKDAYFPEFCAESRFRFDGEFAKFLDKIIAETPKAE